MPEQAKKCIASWHRFMPEYDYKIWNEDSFDVNSTIYTREAYQVKKYAFVSDYVRLWALEQEGGIYLDTDVEVFKAFDDLLYNRAFAGFEGSKHLPIGTCVMASEAHGIWITEMLDAYQGRRFLKPDGSLDLTTNVQFITGKMRNQGFLQNGMEQDYKDLHVFPVDYFSPRRTTGEYLRTFNTYSDHLGLGTWEENAGGWKACLAKFVGKKNAILLIKLKRRLIG